MIKKVFHSDTIIWLVAMAVFFFIYFPMLVVIVYSFNPETVNSFPLKGFSFAWYMVMIQDASLMSALKISVGVALGATCVALLIGVPGALAIHRYSFPGKRLVERIVLLPITLPGILTGVAMLTLLPLIGIPISLTAVVIGHTTFLICIVLTQIVARLKRLDPALEEAAADLGASPSKAFFRVILPNIKTALIGATLLSITLSLDEIPVTFFLIARDNTLPIEIYTMLRRGITPEVNAVATLMFVISLVTLTLSVRFGEKSTRMA